MVSILQFLMQSLPIFIAIAVPGFLASLALFKRNGKFNTLEMFLLGLPLGMFVPSLMAIIEFGIGIQFSPALAIANAIILAGVSTAYLLIVKVNVLPEKKIERKTILWSIGLLVVLFLAFWIRLQAMSPYFYDFDPYWYNQATQFIIEQGQIPVHDDYVWYPNPSNHRASPLMPYMEAGWYHLFSMANGLQSFDFNTMTLVSSLYPPIVGLLLAFVTYLWFSREYSKGIGLIAAAFMAFTPVIVDKMMAPEFELAPFGLFGIVFFYAIYSLTLKYRSKTLAMLASFVLAIGLLGSSSGQVGSFLLAGVIGLTAAFNFLSGKPDKEFIDLNLIVAAGSLIAFFIVLPYRFPSEGISDIDDYIFPLVAVAFAYVLQYLHTQAKTNEDRILYLSGMMIVGVILMLVTPLGNALQALTNMFLYVTTYTNPTYLTIAELGKASTDFSYSLGVLGYNIPFSITPILLILGFLAIAVPVAIKLYSKKEVDNLPQLLVALCGVFPLSIAGVFKSKFLTFTGIMAPIAFCLLIGELARSKRKWLKDSVIAIAAIAVIVQGLQYSDLVFGSAAKINANISDNAQFNAAVCNVLNSEVNGLAASNIPGIVKDTLARAKYVSLKMYCSRIPDSWLTPMFWIRDNVALEDRVMSWWDYGHWINTFGQRKSVTGNTHEYTVMHQEVADKIVYNTPAALAAYMKDHKAKYLLLDQDLIGKWGALVYHSCFYNNRTTLEKGPGASDCDALSYAEQLYVAKNPTSNDVCNLKVPDGTAIKVYSSLGQAYGFGYYCTIDGRLPFIYENGSVAGITDVMPQGEQDGYYTLMALYPSNSTDRKGSYYDSIFYKGFFEGGIPGMTQVYPDTQSDKPTLPVRIFKLN